MSKHLSVMLIVSTCLAALGPSHVGAEEALVLENARLGLSFDRKTGTLTALENKLTGETYGVSQDEFAVEAVEFRLAFPDASLKTVELEDGIFRARYEGAGLRVDVSYTLDGENHLHKV